MNAFESIIARTPNETRQLVTKLLDVADRIHHILEAKGMTQKDLAKAMNKSESEISKWLAGTHNFELKTLIKIEEVLGVEVITILSEVPEETVSA